MSYVEIVGTNGVVVRRSQNLRAILDHARRTPVFRATCHKDSDGGAIVFFEFNSGEWSRVSFADYTVAKRWVKARRSWGLTGCYCSETQYVYH